MTVSVTVKTHASHDHSNPLQATTFAGSTPNTITPSWSRATTVEVVSPETPRARCHLAVCGRTAGDRWPPRPVADHLSRRGRTTDQTGRKEAWS
jgi:hypothetical protein